MSRLSGNQELSMAAFLSRLKGFVLGPREVTACPLSSQPTATKLTCVTQAEFCRS